MCDTERRDGIGAMRRDYAAQQTTEQSGCDGRDGAVGKALLGCLLGRNRSVRGVPWLPRLRYTLTYRNGCASYDDSCV